MATKVSQRHVFAIALAALLAGCGNSGSSMPAAPAHPGSATMGGVLSGPAGAHILDYRDHRVVYVGNIDGKPGLGNVIVYPASLKSKDPNPNRIIQNGTVRPWGICVDSKGTLYVANLPQGAPTIGITEFHPGATSPFRTLNDGMFDPTQVLVADDGTVYVNQVNREGSGAIVSVFAPGSLVVTHVVNVHFSGYALSPNQMAFDTNGDLLVEESAFQHSDNPTTKIFRVNTKTFTISPVNLNLASVDGPGLAVDHDGNIYVSGQYDGQIDVFAPGSTNPTRVIDKGAADLTIMPDGTMYAMNGSGVDEYLPGGSEPVNTIGIGGQGVGVAVGPSH
jgi:sugar lactone lactonase YvrE